MIVIGILFAYALGGSMTWEILVIPCAVIPVIHMISMCFNPDSPKYLLRRGKLLECKNSLQYLRGVLVKNNFFFSTLRNIFYYYFNNYLTLK